MSRRTKARTSATPQSPRRPVAIVAATVLLVVLAVYATVRQGREASSDPASPRASGEERSGPGATPSTHGRMGHTIPSSSRLPDPALARVGDAGAIVPTSLRNEAPRSPMPEGMVWIPPGRFAMGSDYGPFSDARPIHSVELDGFFMDRTTVTNEQFAGFVRETGYVTVAERTPDPRDFPGVPPEAVVSGSIVFRPPTGLVPLGDVSGWWHYVPGACWKHPEGTGSSIAGRERHPVVQVCWEDAAAYARWAGKRLPTEAEWEYAARGGLAQKPYAWGDDFRPAGKLLANTWQGQFPYANTQEDGWAGTAPVGQFPPNGFGLYDMAGNVWQWCADWYRLDAYRMGPAKNPEGPRYSLDPSEPGARKRVQRGGSFLCSDQYCSRYMPGGRGKGAIGTGSSHAGFRCALTPPVSRPRR